MVAAISSLESPRIYRIPEAARYLAASSYMSTGQVFDHRTLTAWVRSETGVPFHTQQIEGPRHISFLDLICMRIVVLLRSQGMTLASIRSAERWLQDYLEVERPFASRPLWIGVGDVFTVLGNSLVSPSRLGQSAFHFVRAWLSKVELDMKFDSTELASSWYPHSNVCLAPAIQMGQPCIAETRIPTSVIRAKVRAGESLEDIGSLYGVDIDRIRSAINWEDRVSAS